jgi:hypothetical protein
MSLQAGSGFAARSGVLRLARRWNASTRLVAVSVSVLFLASLRIPGRPPTLCLLRATTGIPCPFCGGTTAGVDLGHGDPVAALRASPLAVIGGVLFVLTPVIRRSQLAKRWHTLPFRRRLVITTAAIIAALAISEAWQLARFGLL